MIRVTVWNEYLHEKEEPVRHIYPNGIHGCIKEFLQTDEELAIKTATFEMPEHGLTDEVLAQTDVLIFWSHMRQNEFSSGYGTCCTSFGTFLKDYEGTAWNKHDASLETWRK